MACHTPVRMVIMMLLLTGWPWAAFTQEDEAFLQEAGDLTQEGRETLSQATGSLPPSAKNLPEKNDGSLPQETEILREEAGIKVNVSMDLVSSYIWRGVRQGNGPALQPTLEINVGRFTLGAWGSYYFADENHSEADLYATLSLGDFTLGVMDYYYSGTTWWNTDNHAFELHGGWAPGRFSLETNYILNDGAGAAGGDLYFEAGYTAGRFTLFAGAGNGWHTPYGHFGLCNLGLSATKEIKITDHFSLPLTGSLILNPADERLFVVAAISL